MMSRTRSSERRVCAARSFLARMFARTHDKTTVRIRIRTTGPTLFVGENYEQVKHLGKGGTGDTWAFIDKRTGEQVAIKFLRRPLPKVLLENIKREFLIQAELGFGHENVIKAYEAVLTPTHLCLVMEYAKGGSLTGTTWYFLRVYFLVVFNTVAVLTVPRRSNDHRSACCGQVERSPVPRAFPVGGRGEILLQTVPVGGQLLPPPPRGPPRPQAR